MKNYLLLLLMAVIAVSCSKDENAEGNTNNPPPEGPKIEFSENYIDFPYKTTVAQEVTVTTDAEWSYKVEYSWGGGNYNSSKTEWLSVDKIGNRLIISADENYDKAWQRRANIKVTTFGETESSNSMSVYQGAYYFTTEGLNDLLSAVDNIYISDNNGQKVFHYTGEDYPFSIDITLEEDGWSIGGSFTYNIKYYKVSGNNKTNLRLDGIIYLTDYYNNNYVKTINAGSFEMTVTGSEYNNTFSYSSN